MAPSSIGYGPSALGARGKFVVLLRLDVPPYDAWCVPVEEIRSAMIAASLKVGGY